MNSEFELVVVDSLNEELKKKVDVFRQNNSRNVCNVAHKLHLEEHLDQFCSDKDIVKWVLAFDGGVVVGTAAVFIRIIQFGDRVIKLGGVGKVRVDEKHRRKGIASQIMTKVVEQLRVVGADVALLRTDTKSFLMDFYRKYGFELLGRPYKYRGKSDKGYEDEEGMLAPVDSKEIYNMIIQSEELLDIGVGNW